MNLLHKASLFLLIWLIVTLLLYGLLSLFGWVAVLVGFINGISYFAAGIFSLVVGLLCAFICMTSEEDSE